MQHLNLIFSTAQRLQASRSFLRDLRGLDKTSEGIEFAKAIGEAAALGATPEDVVEQVVKAMAGNEAMALEVLGAVQEIAKAHIEQHTRTLASGKTVNVKAYETARTAAMKQTTMAHGATFHAMRTKTPEAHENAAAAHEAAAKMHGEAHEVHPMDVPEVGKEHANLKGQHQLSADYHRQEAATMRHGHGYAVQANRAATASQGAQTAITTQQSQMAHQKAAEEHSKAHEFDPSKGHDAQAAMHTAQAQAAQTVNQSMNSPHQGSDVKAAHDTSLKAHRATQAAHKASTPEAHAAAAKAHEEAINQHMEIHGAKESDEDGHHGQIAKTHMAIHAYHSAKAKGEEVAKATHEHFAGEFAPIGGGHGHATSALSKMQALKLHGNSEARTRTETAWGATSRIAKNDSALMHSRAFNAHASAAKAHIDEVRNNKHNLTEAQAKAHQEISDHHSKAAAEHLEAMRAHKDAATPGVAGSDDLSPEQIHQQAHAANTEANEASRKAHGQAMARAVKEGKWDFQHPAAAAHRASIHATASNLENMQDHKVRAGRHDSAAHAHRSAASKTTGDQAALHTKAAEAHEHASEMYRAAHATGPVTKAEGPMTTMGGGTDIATKEGGAALAIEGRPGKEGGKAKKTDGMDYCDACDSAYPEGTKHECPGTSEVAKAHVESHTRVVGGKTVQVQSYDTHHAAAMQASGTAHTATGKAQTPEQHTQAAALHMKASEAHKTAAAHAPEEWMKKGHEENAKLSEHYAQAHHAKAKAADQRADTGVDTPQHSPQDIKELENHDDYAGFGYLGHGKRSEETDKHLADAANKAGISKHELAAHVLSKSGRHMMDDHTNLPEKASEEEKVAHFQRHLTSPKTAKEHAIKEYAKDLEERAPKKTEPAKEPVTVKPATPSRGHAIPKKPISKEEREAVGKWSERRQGESEDDHFKRVPHLERGGGDDRNESEDAYFDRQHGARKEAMDKESAAKPAAEETLHGKALSAAQAVTGRDKKAMLKYSEAAHKASEHAEKTGKPEDHHIASTLHMSAGMSHDQAREDSGYKKNGHEEAWLAHRAAEKYHRTKAGDAKVPPAEMRAAASKFGARE